MKLLFLCLAADMLMSNADPSAYRLENLKVKALHQYHEQRGGLLTICDSYGISDPGIASIADVVNRMSIKNWDSRFDKPDFVCLKKSVEKGNTSFVYTIKIYRPRNSKPKDLEAMGATDQGQYIELWYLVDVSAAGGKGNSPPASTSEPPVNSSITAAPVQQVPETKRPNPTQKSLDSLLSRVDRIRVVDAGLSGDTLAPLGTNRNDRATVLLDTHKAKQIESFRSCFHIVEDNTTFGYCACLGWPTFEFFSGTTLVARVSLHHGQSIRWSEWAADAVLKRNVDVLKWVAANGAPEPLRSYEADLARAVESQKQYERWLTAAPKSIREQIRALDWGNPFAARRDLQPVCDALSSAESPEAQALALFQWYGSGCGLWSGFPAYEELPNALLLQMPTRVLLRALTNTLSDAQIEGASRFFTSSEFNQQKYPDRKMLPDDLKKKIRDHIARQKDKQKTGQMECYLPK